MTTARDAGALVWTTDDETLRIEPWGQDALRVRAARGGDLPEPLGEDGALLDVGSPLIGFLAGLARFVLGPIESVLTALGAGSRGR